MMEIVLAVFIVMVAWVSARLAVVKAVYSASDADGMIRYMLKETGWVCVFVLGMWWFTNWGTAIIWFFLPRMLFLITTNWRILHENFAELKKLAR